MSLSVRTVEISSASVTAATTAASAGLSCARSAWSLSAFPWQVGDVEAAWTLTSVETSPHWGAGGLCVLVHGPWDLRSFTVDSLRPRSLGPEQAQGSSGLC